MRPEFFLTALLIAVQFGPAHAQPQDIVPADYSSVSDEEIFRAAGFTLISGSWSKCGDPGTASYQPGEILDRGDFNGDGLTDALVAEGGSYCFGMTGTGYTLVTRKNGGNWVIMDERIGIPHLLEIKGVDGWPDIEVGGPGFCFPVLRWNGQEYVVDRKEYEGGRCGE